jgi:hypothetical protein
MFFIGSSESGDVTGREAAAAVAAEHSARKVRSISAASQASANASQHERDSNNAPEPENE